jgi:hypothetical protein
MMWNKLKERVTVAILVAGLVGLSGVVAAPPVDITEYEGAVTADDLFIVDCLLPGPVRQLGQNFTYVAPRRPIRAPARECARRGGEYVAYDRANLKTALAIWKQAADGGDANAQVHLGEIYEKGLGVEPDYAMAAQYFRKAADQGDSRAMINLGALYEGGRGVSRDMTQAMNWYRQAAGLTEGVLEYATEDDIARRRALAEEAEQLRAQVIDLTGQLEDNEKAMARRQRDLKRAQSELDETLAELAKAQASSGLLSEADQRQMDELRAENARLKDDLSEVLQQQVTMEMQMQRSRDVTESAELELARTQVAYEQLRGMQKKAKRRDREALAEQEVGIKAELEAAQAQLDEARKNERLLDAELSRRNEEVASLQGALKDRQTQLAEAHRKLADSDETLEMLMELEIEISEKESELAQYELTTQQLLALLEVGQADSTSLAAVDSDAIRMISPEVGATRGVRAVTLFSDVSEYELIGRVAPRDALMAFRVNDVDRLTEVDGNGLFNVRVDIASSGDTPVAIEAIRKDGGRSEESFLIQKDLPEAIAIRETTQRFRGRLRSDLGNFYALVIGNNNYQNHEDLETATSDAQGVADALRDRYGYDVRLLMNATRDQMVIALSNLARTLEKNDNLLVYYAGHGVLDGGEGYWLPVDAAASRDKSWIGNAQISDFIANMEAKHILVVADSCYSGTLSGTSIRPIPLDIDDQDLLFISRVKARTVLTSGGLQPVLDDGGSGHSIFGGAFISALSGNAEVMEGYRLFETVGREVKSRSRLARVPQDPQYTALKYAGHEGSEFFFLPSAKVSFLTPKAKNIELLAAP